LDDTRSALLATPSGTTKVNVLGRIACSQARTINTGRFVAAPLPLAEVLGGRPGRPDAIEINAAPGTSRAEVIRAVEKVVGGRGVVATPKLLAAQARKGTAAFKQGTSVMVGLSLVVGAFCVFNTVSMTALERRRELATLRAIGGHRRRLLRDFLIEMTMLGVVGSVLGVTLGAFAGRRLIARIPPILVDTVGVQPSFVLARGMVVAALIIGTVVTVGAALFPARNAVTVDPVEAMRSEGPAESAPPRPQTNVVILAIGLTFFVGGSILAVSGAGSAATLIGFSSITLGSLVSQYAGRAQIADAAAWLAARFGNSGRLAAASIARAPRRTWATVTAVTVSVITVVAMGGITSNQIKTFSDPYKSMTGTAVWVATAGNNVIPVNNRFPDSMRDDVARIDGVASVVGSQSAYTTIGGDRVLLQGTDGMSNASQFAAMSLSAKRAVLDAAHPAVAVTKTFAVQQTVHPGDRLTLPTPSGPLVVPIIENVDVVAQTQSGVVVNKHGERHRDYQRPGLTWIEAQAQPGVSPAALKARVTRALGHSPTPAFAYTGEEGYRGAKKSIVASTQIITAMEFAVFAGTALALGNALMISVIERKRELGIVRAIGTTRRQLRRMVLAEAVAIASVGIGLGSFQGLLQHRVGDTAVETLMQATVNYRFTPNPLLSVSVAVLLTAGFAAILPALRAARTNVVEAIGYE
jgi:putative ABC transport system permease protein